jgi:hypothetical protein
MAQTVDVKIGSGHLKGSFGFGKREDYTYGVPKEAINVYLEGEDASSNALNIGSGNGTVTLTPWNRGEDRAYVHAWVNGAVGAPNEVRWTVKATLLL